MNTKQQTVNDIKKLSVTLRGILAVGDELERLGSLEQSTHESETRLKALRSEVETAKDALRVLESDKKKAKADAGILRQRGEDERKELLAKVQVEVEALRLEAAQKAVQESVKAQDELQAVKIATANAKAKLSGLTDSIKEKQTQLEALNKQITSVKEVLAGI
jgi:chromosome segregation ATPase